MCLAIPGRSGGAWLRGSITPRGIYQGKSSPKRNPHSDRKTLENKYISQKLHESYPQILVRRQE